MTFFAWKQESKNSVLFHGDSLLERNLREIRGEKEGMSGRDKRSGLPVSVSFRSKKTSILPLYLLRFFPSGHLALLRSYWHERDPLKRASFRVFLHRAHLRLLSFDWHRLARNPPKQNTSQKRTILSVFLSCFRPFVRTVFVKRGVWKKVSLAALSIPPPVVSPK